MITDLEIEKARETIATKITYCNSELSRENPHFPKDKISVAPSDVHLAQNKNDSVAEFVYEDWHGYVSRNVDRIMNMKKYFDAEHICAKPITVNDGLAYLLTNEKLVPKTNEWNDFTDEDWSK